MTRRARRATARRRAGPGATAAPPAAGWLRWRDVGSRRRRRRHRVRARIGGRRPSLPARAYRVAVWTTAELPLLIASSAYSFTMDIDTTGLGGPLRGIAGYAGPSNSVPERWPPAWRPASRCTFLRAGRSRRRAGPKIAGALLRRSRRPRRCRSGAAWRFRNVVATVVECRRRDEPLARVSGGAPGARPPTGASGNRGSACSSRPSRRSRRASRDVGRDIARAHPRATLYHYYPSKEALYHAVQERVHAQVRELVLTTLGRADLRRTPRRRSRALRLLPPEPRARERRPPSARRSRDGLVRSPTTASPSGGSASSKGRSARRRCAGR